MATLRTTHIKHELAAEPNITLLPDGTTAIPGLTVQGGVFSLSDVSAPGGFSGGDVLSYNGTEWEPDPNVVRSTSIRNIVSLTQASYDAITAPEADVLYIIVEEEA